MYGDLSVSKVHKFARFCPGVDWRIHIVFPQHVPENVFNLLRDCTDFVSHHCQKKRIVAKSKSTAMNLSSHVPTSSSSAKIPIASQSPGILKATGKPESRMRRSSKSDAASSSQARLQDAYLGALMEKATGKLVATKDLSGDVDLSEFETWSQEDAVTEKPMRIKQLRASRKSDCQGGPKAERKEWPHHLHMSPATVHHTEPVFSIVREICGRGRDDPMDHLDVNIAMWGILLNALFKHQSSWTRLRGEFAIREKSSLEQCETVIQ